MAFIFNKAPGNLPIDDSHSEQRAMATPVASTDGRLGIGLMAMGAFVVAGAFRLWVGISDAAYLVVTGMALAALGMALIDPDERPNPASSQRRTPRSSERGWMQ